MNRKQYPIYSDNQCLLVNEASGSNYGTKTDLSSDDFPVIESPVGQAVFQRSNTIVILDSSVEAMFPCTSCIFPVMILVQHRSCSIASISSDQVSEMQAKIGLS